MTREPLPSRRYSESFDFTYVGIHYAGQVSFYPDGRVGEVFLGMEKAAGTAMDVTARDAAILISIGLQHGVELGEMLHSATRDEYNKPEGLIGSLLHFLWEYEPKVDGWGAPRTIDAETGAEPSQAIGEPAETVEMAKAMGYTGDQCTNCNGLHMKVSGHCFVCADCGTTTSCS